MRNTVILMKESEDKSAKTLINLGNEFFAQATIPGMHSFHSPVDLLYRHFSNLCRCWTWFFGRIHPRRGPGRNQAEGRQPQ